MESKTNITTRSMTFERRPWVVVNLLVVIATQAA
jgi:hypothetical protein